MSSARAQGLARGTAGDVIYTDCPNLHWRSLGGLGHPVTSHSLRCLGLLGESHLSFVGVRVVGVLVRQVIEGVVDGAGVPHLLHGPLIGVSIRGVDQHAKVQGVETGDTAHSHN